MAESIFEVLRRRHPKPSAAKPDAAEAVINVEVPVVTPAAPVSEPSPVVTQPIIPPTTTPIIEEPLPFADDTRPVTPVSASPAANPPTIGGSAVSNAGVSGAPIPPTIGGSAASGSSSGVSTNPPTVGGAAIPAVTPPAVTSTPAFDVNAIIAPSANAPAPPANPAAFAAPLVDVEALRLPTPGVPTLPTNKVSTPDEGLQAMLEGLRRFLPPGGGTIAFRSVQLVSLTERPLAIGNRRGLETHPPFDGAELTGGRLDAVVRLQIGATTSGAAEEAMRTVQERLLRAKDDLFVAGYMRFAITETSALQPLSDGRWMQTMLVAVLYEYHLVDDDTAGLIARIPVNMGEYGTFDVTAPEFVAWSNVEARPLLLRDPGAVTGVAILWSLPVGWNGLAVNTSVRMAGATRQNNTASVRAFANLFTPEGTLVLGDKTFQVGRLNFASINILGPVVLRERDDFFQIRYAANAFDHADAIVYLRALR
ncbi:MAG: hypothetical protein JNJ61_30590 [Anaerolineae bacterium]|nr:hypothetical protein [Anaerolineae bacterium]